jgi:hypothetical protein
MAERAPDRPVAGEAEVERRVAVLHRFRELLAQQRQKFQTYLKILDHERSDIETGDVDKLVAHVELEEQIVSEIYTFQKVIDPIDELYRSAFPVHAGESDVPSLKTALADLKIEVSRRNQENRVLLKRRMEIIRSEIAGFRNPLSSRKSVFAGGEGGSIIDIKG